MDPGLQRLLVLALLVGVVGGIALLGLVAVGWELIGSRKMTSGERSLFRICAGLCVIVVVCFCYGRFIEADWIEVTHHTIRTPKLAAGTRIRIVHLSDLHVERRSRAIEKLKPLIDGEKPDSIVFTGDSINSVEGLGIFREVFGSLTAPMGRFAVKGNHDLWYWRDKNLFGDGVATELGTATPTLLAGGKIALCGAPYDFIDNLPPCLAAAKNSFRIAAYHTPDLVEYLQGDPPDLYLAGHTHGGQIRLPFYGAVVTLSDFDKKYEMGMYQVGATTLYVNRGIGFQVSAPRVRFLCRPEIAVIDLIGSAEP